MGSVMPPTQQSEVFGLKVLAHAMWARVSIKQSLGQNEDQAVAAFCLCQAEHEAIANGVSTKVAT